MWCYCFLVPRPRDWPPDWAARPPSSPHLISYLASKYRYVAQDFGKNSCSQGTLVDTVAECRQAALELRGSPTLATIKSWSYYPKGCSEDSEDNEFYFNTHSTGRGDPDSSPVCKVKGRYIPHTLRTHTLSKAHITSPHLHLCLVLLYSVQHYKPRPPAQ